MDYIDPRQVHWFDVMIFNDNPLLISQNWMILGDFPTRVSTANLLKKLIHWAYLLVWGYPATIITCLLTWYNIHHHPGADRIWMNMALLKHYLFKGFNLWTSHILPSAGGLYIYIIIYTLICVYIYIIEVCSIHHITSDTRSNLSMPRHCLRRWAPIAAPLAWPRREGRSTWRRLGVSEATGVPMGGWYSLGRCP